MMIIRFGDNSWDFRRSTEESELIMEAFFELVREFDKRVSFIVNKDEDCSAHFHSNIEIFYVVSGCIDATVRGVCRRLYAGDIAIACSYEPHSFTNVGKSQLNVWLFPAELVSAFTVQTNDKTFKTPFLSRCSRTDEIVSNMEHLRRYVDSDDSLTATGYMYAILGILQEEIGFVKKTDYKQSDILIQKILVYIEEHFRDNLTVSDISREFGYNKDYISKIINSHIHCSFKRYVNLLRARNAKNLIENSDKSLDEICFLSGFGCMKSFRRAFTEYYDLTPREYQIKRSGIRSN